MYGFNSLVGRNADIRPEEYKIFEKEVFISARQARLARDLYGTPLGPMGLGKQVYEYDALTEMSDAIISFAFEDNEDIINLTRVAKAIPILQKQFKVNRRDLIASRQYGTPLDTTNAQAAGYKVGLKEEALLIDGYKPDGTNYKLKGFLGAAGLTEATALDFGTASYGPKKIALMVGALAGANIRPPYNVLLHPDQYTEAASLYTSGHIITNLDEIEKQLKGGMVEWTTEVPTGTALMMATPNRGFWKLVIAQDLLTEYWEEKKAYTMGRVFECVTPVIKEANGICKGTGC